MHSSELKFVLTSFGKGGFAVTWSGRPAWDEPLQMLRRNQTLRYKNSYGLSLIKKNVQRVIILSAKSAIFLPSGVSWATYI